MTPGEVRDQRVASLFGKRAKSLRTLFREAARRWGYTEEEVRASIVTLDCRVTPAFRVRLPRDNEPGTPEWSGA